MNEEELKKIEVSAPTIAKCIGISERQVFRLVKEGMPFSDSRGNLFDCVAWYVKRKVGGSLVEEKRKKLRAETEKIRFELRVRKKQILLASDVRAFVAHILVSLKDSLSSVGSSVCNDVLNAEHPGIARQMVEDKIREALNNCSKRLNDEYEAKRN